LAVLSQGKPLRLYLKSAVCTVWFRIRGIDSSLVSCDGRLPVLYGAGKVTIGKGFATRGRLLPCELGSATAAAELRIGDGVFINQGASVVAHSYIEIGDNTLIGDFAAVYDTNHHGIDSAHPTKSAAVIIGTNVWIGRCALVMPGSRIGDHTVVTAGSVVKGDLPARVLADGNPARVVRHLEIADSWTRQ
jgi:acetyltransferase-like isoleucine patch superfamily enzyme